MFLLAKNWWSLLFRGIVAVLFGIFTFIWTGVTLNVLVLVFGAYAFIDGIVNIAGAIRHSRLHQRWVWLLIEGIGGILAGVVTVIWPAITLAVLILLIAFWAIVTGILEVAAAIRLRKHVAGEWLLALSGIASTAFGILLLVAPLTGAFVVAIWFGVYAVVWGILLISLAVRLRAWGRLGPADASSASMTAGR